MKRGDWKYNREGETKGHQMVGQCEGCNQREVTVRGGTKGKTKKKKDVYIMDDIFSCPPEHVP